MVQLPLGGPSPSLIAPSVAKIDFLVTLDGVLVCGYDHELIYQRHVHEVLLRMLAE